MRNKAQKVWSLRLEAPCHVRRRPVNERSVDVCEQPLSGHFFRPENTSTNSPASQIADRRFRDNDVPDWFDLSVVCLTPGALPSDNAAAGAHDSGSPVSWVQALSPRETLAAERPRHDGGNGAQTNVVLETRSGKTR